jgi:hypothetical protein
MNATTPEKLKFTALILDSLNAAHSDATQLRDMAPELARYEIGNSDELITRIEQAIDIVEHVAGNIINPKP